MLSDRELDHVDISDEPPSLRQTLPVDSQLTSLLI